MKVITKYISKQIINIFLLCNFIFVLLYLVVDFIQKIDDFVKADVPLVLTLFFFLYKIPTMVMDVIPAATMISIVVVICQMKKNKEVMAIKACGINLYKVFQPVILISLLISIFSFLLAEIIVPYTSTRSNEIMEIEVKKRHQASYLEWYKSKNSIYWIKHFNTETKTINDPVFYFFDDQFNITQKISGETCRWIDGVWEIKNAKILTLEKDNTYSTTKQSRCILKIPETPETFITKKRKSENISYAELKRHAEEDKAEGFDNTADLVNLYMKLSNPFMAVVLALIAIPLGLWEKINGIPLAVTLGIFTFFILLVTTGSAQAFGLAGILPPLLSAWTANILFSLSGIYLLMNIKK
ncbi:MAG: LptF/LptG family permease [Desulfobacteraceae bacterium]|jgi:lipopolysaccharide export system permease protein